MYNIFLKERYSSVSVIVNHSDLTRKKHPDGVCSEPKPHHLGNIFSGKVQSAQKYHSVTVTEVCRRLSLKAEQVSIMINALKSLYLLALYSISVLEKQRHNHKVIKLDALHPLTVHENHK